MNKPFGLNLTIGLTEPERRESDMQLIEEFEVPVLITSYGNPTEYVKRAAKRGTVVFHDVINLKHAKKAQEAGVDAIIGVSAGAGGHAGQISPYTLIPYLRDNLDVPIIAAGCISTGEQIAASLALGAELAYMGTRFITSTECQAELEYKQMVVDAVPEDLVYTDQVSGTHANFFKRTVPTHPDYDPTIAGDESKRWKSIWSAGQGSALIHEVKPVEEIVEELDGCGARLWRLARGCDDNEEMRESDDEEWPQWFEDAARPYPVGRKDDKEPEILRHERREEEGLCNARRVFKCALSQ